MRTIAVVLMAGLTLALAGCTQEPLEPQAGMGTMQINMVDNPAAYDAVNIVVDSVQVHIAGADSSKAWITLSTVPATYDLLTYVNGTFAVIGAGQVPAGRCSQLRMFIGSGSNVVVDGQTHALTIPSGVQSGVKILVNVEVEAGSMTTLTLDFDANLSVVQTGPPSSPEYILNPVIRTKTEASGSIQGTVSPSSSRATVWARNEMQETFSTTTDEFGGFILHCLPPGTYTISVTTDNALSGHLEIAGITVHSAATANLGAVLLVSD
ncbi:MAG TPA: DUF4382 domain-containing protein [Bacteroidota bacterium]